ncbi:MAG: hypothetical protein LBV08_01750 [Clostridiales bacterium]|jgi:hypothetical protein|nr:hypothetical protein [Clostridiales bacterium]
MYFAVINCDSYALGEVHGKQIGKEAAVDFFVTKGTGAAAKAVAKTTAGK